MPSQKAQIMVRTTDKTKTKLQRIADKEKRSLSNITEIIIEYYIEQYEKEHDVILLPEEREDALK